MENETFGPSSLRLPATLLLVGQLLYIAVTLFHAGGDANSHRTVFATYAANGIWTAVHLGQFGAMTILLGGLFALRFALEPQTTEAGVWAARFGAAASVAALALYGALQAVDGVALKQAVNAWAGAAEADKVARFATAEGLRWLEWGMRSYANFTVGAAVMLFGAAASRTMSISRPIPYLMGLAGLTYLAQGWIGAVEGFTPAHSTAIVLSWVLNLAWMMSLAVIASRREFSLSHRKSMLAR